MSNIFTILIGAILVNNFVMSRFLGCCPFLGVSKKIETAFGMGMAVTFVMALASLVTYLIQTFVLNTLGLQYMQTIAFILVIAVLVQIVEMALKKISPSLYQALGVYLPLITTNCAVLGVAILSSTARLLRWALRSPSCFLPVFVNASSCPTCPSGWTASRAR